VVRRLILGVLWLFRPISAILFLFFCLVPEKIAYLLSWPIGWLIRIGKRSLVLERMRLLLGEDFSRNRSARELWRSHLIHLGRNVIEPFYFYHLPDDKLVARVDITGQEHLGRALDRGRGGILFLNHLGNPGAIVAGLGLRGYDLTIAGNAMVATIGSHEVPLVHVENAVQRMFSRGHVRRALLGDRLPQRMNETLARNGLFAMFIDFPVARKHNQIVVFGNARMNVNLGPAILALRSQSPVLPVTCIRVGNNQHHLTIHPPLEIPDPTDESAPATLMHRALECLWPDLKRHPEQWWPWDWAQLSPKTET
jgi:KDO2-lipid IV(A) lauroyltransferase